MIKLPSLDDIKKFVTDLIDTTKSINVKEVVEHFKSGETATQKNEASQQLFHRMRVTLQELNKPHANKEMLIKQLEQQLAELEKIMNLAPFSKPEDKK